jgi:iron complex transport system substrate-binding protein
MRLAVPGPHRGGGITPGAAGGVRPAEIDRLVSASVGGGQPIYRLDIDAIRDLRPDLVLAQDLCAVCAVPSGHIN